MINAIWTLIKYVLLFTVLVLNPLGLFTDQLWLVFVNPFFIFLMICAIGAFLGSRYCLLQWYNLDVAVATIAHGTYNRTISGIAGQRAYEMPSSRWVYVARVIDILAEILGDGSNHCYRAYKYEMR